MPRLPQPQAPVLRARRRERSQNGWTASASQRGAGAMRKREARVQPSRPRQRALLPPRRYYRRRPPDASRYGSTRAAVTTAAVPAPMQNFRWVEL